MKTFDKIIDELDTITPSKVYTKRTNDEAVALQPCFLNMLRRHTDILTDKGFSLFDEYAARCGQLSRQEGKYTSSSWGNSKSYASRSIAISHRMLIEINESGAITEITIWVESETAKHLKTFRIISNEILISFLILCWFLVLI